MIYSSQVSIITILLKGYKPLFLLPFQVFNKILHGNGEIEDTCCIHSLQDMLWKLQRNSIRRWMWNTNLSQLLRGIQSAYKQMVNLVFWDKNCGWHWDRMKVITETWGIPLHYFWSSYLSALSFWSVKMGKGVGGWYFSNLSSKRCYFLVFILHVESF